MAKDKERRGLGRGLSALMADVAPPEPGDAAPRRSQQAIPVDRIHPNPDQPRRTFQREALDELAASIREKGVIQPLILRADPSNPEAYQIVAGERRWRAAQIARLHEVPAIVREFDDLEVLEIAIIENIQRADLNAIEEAAGYRQLMDRFGHTQEKLAEALGKSRSHIANTMRLLTLPDLVQDMVAEGKLSAGHARALVTASDPLALAREVADRGLSGARRREAGEEDGYRVEDPGSRRPARMRTRVRSRRISRQHSGCGSPSITVPPGKAARSRCATWISTSSTKSVGGCPRSNRPTTNPAIP